ncbi:hypothetical protein N7537_008259 [Penicillium hordei]|uniref:Uncharacterized protein n=1 Tax=Penicillium hordei TaxID=40994 RepID=A0AAD6GY98_9EURO|nr:uncharacterized protein N7537_008259 [Penicillium hordei]KAJ5598175.1 hypothetical protein N7537_008259 [Penicillium hordei]
MLRLWDTATGVLQHTLEVSHWIASIAFSSDSHLLAIRTEDQTLQLWDTATGDLEQTLSPGGVLTFMEFSNDGSRLRPNIGSLDIQSRSWDYTSEASQSSQGITIQPKQWVALNEMDHWPWDAGQGAFTT